MRRNVHRMIVAALWICLTAFCPRDARPQGSGDSSDPSNITLEIVKKLDITADDRSYVHIVLQGKYQIAPRQLAPGIVRDGRTVTIYLKYLGGQMLRGDGAGQGHKVAFSDASAVRNGQYSSTA
jgi:hypothetical protein